MAQVNSVRRALASLDLLSDGEKRSLSDIARELSLAKSTASNLLETLTSQRVVERNRESGFYSLGIRLIELGDCTQTGHELGRIAAPVLRGLNQFR